MVEKSWSGSETLTAQGQHQPPPAAPFKAHKRSQERRQRETQGGFAGAPWGPQSTHTETLGGSESKMVLTDRYSQVSPGTSLSRKHTQDLDYQSAHQRKRPEIKCSGLNQYVNKTLRMRLIIFPHRWRVLNHHKAFLIPMPRRSHIGA